MATRVLRAFLRHELQEDVLGDLKENFDFDRQEQSLWKAKANYWKQVLLYIRPFAIRKLKSTARNPITMYKSYLRAAVQNIVKNKLHAFINISGLAIGMAVAIIISLWIYDEVSFNTQYKNHKRIGQVIQNVTNNGQVETWWNVPWVLGDEIRQNYGTDFSGIAMASHMWPHTITIDKEKYIKNGMYVEEDFLTLFDIELVKGTLPDKNDPSSLIVSESAAETFFGTADPVGQALEMDGATFQVSGVYKDLPVRSRWVDVHFLAQWSKYIIVYELEQMEDRWRPNGFQLFVMLADHATFNEASLKIKDAKLRNVNEALAKKKPALFVISMPDWHLRSEFENGVQTGGLIQYVWMFGIVGVFVLFMACINFMNLSTARSEKRAKEVGIRKAVGSYRGQLITQFFSESILTTFISLLLAVGVAHVALPLFNGLAEKNMSLPWSSPNLWIGIVVLSVVIGIIAGSYPALYLSGIRPAGALKGAFKAGRGAIIPRKVLVVLQFSVSVIMIIGTATVYLQIQHGKNRPLGYNVNWLVSLPSNQTIHTHLEAITKELTDKSAILSLAESTAPVTQGWGSSSHIDWEGKDPDLSIDFNVFENSVDYGKTIQWEILQGRDFSRDFPSDSMGVILNEGAAKYLDKPEITGGTLRANGGSYTIVGVVRDVVFGDPYQPTRPTVYFLSERGEQYLTFRLNPDKPASESIANIEAVLKPHLNGAPFSFQFLDESQARKFGNEQRVSTLASTFAALAIFISCLGIFGLSSFVAEQRTKEIGLRKVLGANLVQLWILMSKDFVVLVVISCLIATPLAWWLLQSWLEGYEYRVSLPYWIFFAATIGTLVITMLTISWHMLKAARVNPAQTLKVE
jgi:ABC-type antimicrobial peptide transport system permease subunit